MGVGKTNNECKYMFHRRNETSTTHMFCVCRINTLEKYLKKKLFFRTWEK